MSDPQQSTVLLISQVYVPDPTAVGQYMHEAAKELAQRGFRVRVLTSARGYEDSSVKYPVRQTIDGVQIRRLPLSSFGKSSILIRLIGGFLFTFQCILHGLCTRRMKYLVVSTSPPMAPLAAIVLRLFRRIHITYWVMDLNPDQMIALGKARPDSLQVKVFDWLNRQILRRSRAVVALDRFMADRLNAKADIRDKLAVFPPWPLEDHVEPVAHAENPFRDEHGLQGKTVIMYSGNLSLASPVTTILQAARRVTDLNDLVFLFIGGGLGKKEIDTLIASEHLTNVRTLPYQPIERLRYSLSAADVHLVSVGEAIVGICHPCKIYGSLAVARPILSLGPKECHAADILGLDHVGWTIEHGDVDRAEQVLREIHSLTEAQRMEMGQAARRLVDAHFTKQELCGRFADIVEHGVTQDAACGLATSSQCRT